VTNRDPEKTFSPNIEPRSLAMPVKSAGREQYVDISIVQNEYGMLERNRKFAAVFRIAKAVDGFERRLAQHIDPVKVEINWPKIEEELTNPSERVALHWMQALTSGEFPSGSKAISLLWVTDGKIKEAIVCALVESAFAGYVLDERYLRPPKSPSARLKPKSPIDCEATPSAAEPQIPEIPQVRS
jgi:hypothetical protein